MTLAARLPRRDVEVLPDLAAVSRAAADRIVDAAGRSIAARGRFTMAVSGGQTPRLLYDLLGTEDAGRLPWARTWIFFADERCVPPDRPESNYGMVRDVLLSRIPGLESRTVRIEGERPAADAAARYDAALRVAFADRDGGGALFDVAILGVGTDGHTASLFPGSPALTEHVAWVTAATAPPTAPVAARVTLTYPALDAARTTLVLCAGADKRDILAAIAAAGDSAPQRYPAARITARERCWWLFDRAAVPDPSRGPFGDAAPPPRR